MTGALARFDARQRLVLLLAMPLFVGSGMVLAAAPWQAALAFALAAGAAAAVACYRPVLYPLIFLAPFESNFLGLAFYYPWSVREIDLFPLHPFLLALPLCGLGLSRLAKASRPPFRDALRPLLAVFAAWAVVSMAWAPLFAHSLLHCSVVVANILLYFYVVGIVDREVVLRRAMLCLVAYGLLVALANLLVRYSPEVAYKVRLLDFVNFEFYVRGMEINFRSRSIASDNMTAYTQNLFMAATAAHLLWAKTLRGRLFFGLCLLFMVWGMLLCQSKAGTISFIVMVGYFLLVFKRLRRHFFLWAPVCVASFVGVFFLHTLYLDDPKTPRLLYEIGTQSLSWRWRLDLWSRYWDRLASGRLFEGLGAGGFIFDAHVPHAHSIYLSVFFDFGLVGLLLLLAGMAVMIGRFFELSGRQETYPQIVFLSLCGGLVTMAVQGVFDSSYLMPVITLFTGLGSAACALARRDAAAGRGGRDPR